MGTGLAPLALALIAFCTATPPLAAAQAPPPRPGSPRASKVAKCHTFGNLALELAHQGRYWARSFAQLERASRRF